MEDCISKVSAFYAEIARRSCSSPPPLSVARGKKTKNKTKENSKHSQTSKTKSIIHREKYNPLEEKKIIHFFWYVLKNNIIIIKKLCKIGNTTLAKDWSRVVMTIPKK